MVQAVARKQKKAKRSRREKKLGQVPVSVPVTDIHPSDENDLIYNPIDRNDPDLVGLSESIAKLGLLDPIIITLDHWILSGHRRYAASRMAGLNEVRVVYKDYRKEDEPDRFLTELRAYNHQRNKTREERLREAVADVDPEEAYDALVLHRRDRLNPVADQLQIGTLRNRCKISDAKQPFLDAIQKALEELKDFWPVSDRQLHYRMLNNPPPKHASKPGSIYKNDLQSYKALVELVTRARLDGSIPMHCIQDETRPVAIWQCWKETGTYETQELSGFLKGFARDLMQSQPSHIEIIAEKNTIKPMVEQVAMDFRIPVTTSRGYSSIPPRYAIQQRFLKSGKDQLILLVLSDFDPEGESIAECFARSMRDDFDIDNIKAVKVALNQEQVERFKIPPGLTAKTSSSRFKSFTAKHGHLVYELEALSPEQLQDVLREAIEQVIDMDALQAEIDAEKQDAAHLEGVRRQVKEMLASMNLG